MGPLPSFTLLIQKPTAWSKRPAVSRRYATVRKAIVKIQMVILQFLYYSITHPTRPVCKGVRGLTDLHAHTFLWSVSDSKVAYESIWVWNNVQCGYSEILENGISGVLSCFCWWVTFFIGNCASHKQVKQQKKQIRCRHTFNLGDLLLKYPITPREFRLKG